jgi:preprotein translocase subunit SecG
MQSVLLAVHLLIALALIGVIMLQRSEGGALGMGSGGGSGNIFSARGVGNALTRTTAILAVCFFVTSISLTLVALHGTRSGGGLFGGTQQQAPAGSVLPQLPGAPSPGSAPLTPEKPLVPVTP